MKKTVYIVGIGMDGIKTLTIEGKEAIDCAEAIIGAKRMLEPFSDLGKEIIISYKAEQIADFILQSDKSIFAVLMSGDCGFYSGAERLVPLLAENDCCNVQIVAGISSPAYFCAKLARSMCGMKLISLHGRDTGVAVNVTLNQSCFFLLGGDIGAADVCQRLCEYGLGDANVYIGERLAYCDERIYRGKASEFTKLSTEKLSVIIVENPNPLESLPSCIPDGRFLREKIPMTKSEVRCIAAAKLCISKTDVCWDIGCGTGSVSVEMAFRCPEGQVFAVDKNPSAVKLTLENSRHFGCDNITVACMDVPVGINSLPVPDKAFIGGSSGKLGTILSEIYSRNPECVTVITAVSIETLAEAASELEHCTGSAPEILEAAVTRTRKIGGHTMFASENPVYIICSK